MTYETHIRPVRLPPKLQTGSTLCDPYHLDCGVDEEDHKCKLGSSLNFGGNSTFLMKSIQISSFVKASSICCKIFDFSIHFFDKPRKITVE